ncbi:MAG: hypothetical protein MMC33_005961 [Icmadophila ericetorum]|nr:hypothetical protein [Icmadophila ericetorum]
MYFTFALPLLITALIESSSASSSSPPSFNYHDASQSPLGSIANLQPKHPQEYWGRCPRDSIWRCWFRYKVVCGCHESDKTSLSSADATAQFFAEAQKTTSLQVLTEIEPGNNNTRVSLFELPCDKKQYVACTQTDGGFECGCYDHSDIGAHEHGGLEEKGEMDATSREVPKHKYEEVSEGQDGDFKFQRLRLPVIPCDLCCFEVSFARYKCLCC